jgi:hypothetical protein
LDASADAVAEELDSNIAAARIPMMTITISNSTNVKPFRAFITHSSLFSPSFEHKGY